MASMILAFILPRLEKVIFFTSSIIIMAIRKVTIIAKENKKNYY